MLIKWNAEYSAECFLLKSPLILAFAKKIRLFCGRIFKESMRNCELHTVGFNFEIL